MSKHLPREADTLGRRLRHGQEAMPSRVVRSLSTLIRQCTPWRWREDSECRRKAAVEARIAEERLVTALGLAAVPGQVSIRALKASTGERSDPRTSRCGAPGSWLWYSDFLRRHGRPRPQRGKSPRRPDITLLGTTSRRRRT